MDENLKMFLGLISEKMNAPEVESLETEAKELEAQLEKNRQELEALQQEIAALSAPEEAGAAGRSSEDSSASGSSPMHR